MFFQFKDKFPHLRQHWDTYIGMHKRIEVPTRTILLHEGEISKRSFVVEKGCLRVWFNNNGKDTTFQFFFEGEGLASLESFRKNIPGMFTIETIEPCIIYVLEKKDYETIMLTLNKEVDFLNEMLNISFERQLHYMKEFLSFIRDTPQQRYLNLLNDKPQIIQRVPQHYIASYLGITTVHLSRIKSRLLKEKHQADLFDNKCYRLPVAALPIFV
jgi:CRP-like cAMP-binding protein